MSLFVPVVWLAIFEVKNSVDFRHVGLFRSSACKMVRTLVQLMRTLDMMPEEVINT
jgi:hypothetical protein